MVIPVYIEHIALVFFCTLGIFLNAKQVNDKSSLPEDDYLPRKRRKMSFMFLFISPNSPVRWRAYWMHRLAQFYFWMYIVIMVIWRCLSGSFVFLTRSVFAFYPIFMLFSDVALELSVFIYVKIKKLISKK